MNVFNVVKFKVKDGQDEVFLKAHREGKAKWPGLIKGTIINTGERSYCLIGEWSSTDALVSARPAMIKTLDGFRAVLDDLGDGRGLTDAVSGPAVLTI